MPYWQNRECWPEECDACPKCSEVERTQWIVYFTAELPVVVIGIGLWVMHKRKKFNVIASYSALGSVAVLVFKNLTNSVAMYIMFLSYEAGVIDDISNAILQLIFWSISILFSISTIYTTAVVSVYKYQQDRRELNFNFRFPGSTRKIP